MKRIFFMFALVLIGGCAFGRASELRGTLIERDAQIARCDEQIRVLQLQLDVREEELKAKDTEIEELKKKLRNFGVF